MALTDKVVRGMIININGDPHLILEREFYKPGKGGAYNKTKLKNLRNGKIFLQTYKSTEKVDEINVDTKNMIYSYVDGAKAVFMDAETYEQVEIDIEQIPGGTSFLMEGEKYIIVSYEGVPLSVQPPIKMIMTVTETTDAVKGNTSGNATKEAVLETGFTLQVPMFIKQGEKIEINTETGQYNSKA